VKKKGEIKANVVVRQEGLVEEEKETTLTTLKATYP